MKDSKYRSTYIQRVNQVLGDIAYINSSITNLIEFLFTRTIWIRRDNVYKAYLDIRGLLISTLSLPASTRLLILLMAIRYEESQINYYRTLYKSQDIRINPYTLVEVYLLICNALQEEVHKDVMLLLPNSVEDIINLHYERLYNLFPTKSQQIVINILRNLSNSFMSDIRLMNRELNIYTEYELSNVIAPLVENNSIATTLSYISSRLGINSSITNELINMYNSLILDTYQLNQ